MQAPPPPTRALSSSRAGSRPFFPPLPPPLGLPPCTPPLPTPPPPVHSPLAPPPVHSPPPRYTQGVLHHGFKWQTIGEALSGRSVNAVRNRYLRLASNAGPNSGPPPNPAAALGVRTFPEGALDAAQQQRMAHGGELQGMQSAYGMPMPVGGPAYCDGYTGGYIVGYGGGYAPPSGISPDGYSPDSYGLLGGPSGVGSGYPLLQFNHGAYLAPPPRQMAGGCLHTVPPGGYCECNPPHSYSQRHCEYHAAASASASHHLPPCYAAHPPYAPHPALAPRPAPGSAAAAMAAAAAATAAAAAATGKMEALAGMAAAVGEGRGSRAVPAPHGAAPSASIGEGRGVRPGSGGGVNGGSGEDAPHSHTPALSVTTHHAPPSHHGHPSPASDATDSPPSSAGHPHSPPAPCSCPPAAYSCAPARVPPPTDAPAAGRAPRASGRLAAAHPPAAEAQTSQRSPGPSTQLAPGKMQISAGGVTRSPSARVARLPRRT
jgi:hypothetical protein